MHLITRNVNTAFRELVGYVSEGNSFNYLDSHPQGHVRVFSKPSRNGPVLMIDEPVTISYTHPKERVLFNAARDANPFFHMYEALWMLAGRNDVSPVAYYAKNMLNYSDDGKTLNGAYGYRWRHANDYDVGGGLTTNVDQLDIIVSHLKADPDSRRAVLQMWNVEDDLLKIGPWSETNRDYMMSRDVCCNLSVMFSMRETGFETLSFNEERHNPLVPITGTEKRTIQRALDMTVTNRSNDMIWGMLGANYVHFSFLQEYVAARLGVEVGRYHHITNNLHVYESNWKPKEWLGDETRGCYVRENSTFPIVSDPTTFEKELREVVSWYDGTRDIDTLINTGPREHEWKEPFLEGVAGRIFTAFALYKAKDYHGALAVLGDCPADDWRIAAINWIQRRIKT